MMPPLDEIVYRLFVLNKIHQGIQDIDASRVISSEALAWPKRWYLAPSHSRMQLGLEPRGGDYGR